MAALNVADLTGVVYSAGKAFDGLSTGRLETENFLRSGSLDGVTSRPDLLLLEDLRDTAQLVLDHRGPIDADFVREVNRTISRSGALHPGQLRTPAQRIGVSTRFGRHTPPALTEDGLQQLIDAALSGADLRENSLDLFVNVAKAQPFEDGNKRTAIFAATALLIGAGAATLLTIPVDDPRLADSFNTLLAAAYLHDEHDGVKDLLRTHGLVGLPTGRG